MPSFNIALALLSLGVLALLITWTTGGRFRRRTARYVPIGLTSRRYIVWFPIPRKPEASVPVVLAFHGGGCTLEQFEEHAALHAARAASNFAIVYPEGYHMTWNAGRCCGDALQSNIDDVKFIRSILDDLESILKIDRRRIYATGFSNGAMLCYYLACNLSEEIAAIAPVGGNMFVSECGPKRPLPIFHLHGLADEWAPYEGGQSIASHVLPSVAEGLAFWRRVNGSDVETRQSMFGGCADCSVYSGGPEEAQVRICVIPSLGHHWPGGVITARSRPEAAMYGPAGPALDLNQVNDAILNFLGKYSLPQGRLRRVSIGSDTVLSAPHR
jgi:polyhydroxybutyrate depolymerase